MKKLMVSVEVGLVFILLSAPILAQETGVGPWVKINDMSGIATYSRTNVRAAIKECKAVGLVDAPVEVLENMMRDYNAYKSILFMSKKVTPIELPGYNNTADTRYAYLLQGAPWPVADRDGAGRLDFYVQKGSNAVLIKCKVIMPEYPKPKRVVRIPFCEMEWILKPVTTTSTLVTYQVMLDPGGSIDALPISVVNYVMKYYGTFTVQNIRKVARDARYKNAKEIVTQTALPDNLAYYLE